MNTIFIACYNLFTSSYSHWRTILRNVVRRGFWNLCVSRAFSFIIRCPIKIRADVTSQFPPIYPITSTAGDKRLYETTLELARRVGESASPRLAIVYLSLREQMRGVRVADRFQLANEINRRSDMFAPYVFISMTIHLRSVAASAVRRPPVLRPSPD